MTRSCSVLLLSSILGVACSARDARPRVFVAASAAECVAAICASESVAVQSASSSVLARQLLHGARADVFVSAHHEWIDALVERDLVDERRPFAKNGVVLIRRVGSDATLTSFQGRIALGDPAHVPVGVYAKAALEAAGQWAALATRVASATDARHALGFVESGACELGIVYATDAMASDRVELVGALPLDRAPVYEVCLLAGAGPDGRRLFERLVSPNARVHLQRHGFSPVE